MAESCITQDLKTFLLNMIEKKRPYEVMQTVVEDGFSVCKEGAFAAPSAARAATEAKRTMATRWPEAIFVDKKGKETEYDSASALYEKLTGKKPSGSICNEKGDTCRPVSLIDSFRFFGYIIQGDGEDAPESDPEKPGDTLKAHTAWKDHLNATNKKLIVIHPKSPTIKKIQA